MTNEGTGQRERAKSRRVRGTWRDRVGILMAVTGCFSVAAVLIAAAAHAPTAAYAAIGSVGSGAVAALGMYFRHR
jgi:hypothetical protein